MSSKNPVEVYSDIMGSFAMQSCDNGCEVEEGETILVVECMKLMYDVCAPVSGTVEFLCRLGDVIDDGQVLARITPKE